MLSFFPRDVLDEIWDLIESVSEVFPSYSCSQYVVAFGSHTVVRMFRLVRTSVNF